MIAPPLPYQYRPKHRPGPTGNTIGLLLSRYRHREYIVQTHRPSRRRLRIVRFAGFPIPALVARCQCCGRVWPCRDLIATLRESLGWTHRLDSILKRLRREIP